MSEEKQDTNEAAGTLGGDIEELANAMLGTGTADEAQKESVAETAAAEETASDEAPAQTEADEHSEEDADEASAAEQGKANLALIERGVKAGIPMEDMLAMGNQTLAQHMVEMAERHNRISDETDKGNEDEGAGNPADELGAALAEMEKDGEYDPKILKLLKGLYTENQALKSARETADRQGFFEKQFGSLDEGVRSHVDASKLSKLRSKFDMLERGYGSDSGMTREEVFKEAVQLALGDLVNSAAEERKAKALEQRKNLKLARPGGENGQTRGGVPADDPFADFLAAMG